MRARRERAQNPAYSLQATWKQLGLRNVPAMMYSMASNEPPTHQRTKQPPQLAAPATAVSSFVAVAAVSYWPQQLYGSAMPVITSSQRIFRKAQPLSTHAGLAAFQLAIGRQALCNGSLDCRPCPLLRDLVIMSSKIVFF